jgi:hypothetical protein
MVMQDLIEAEAAAAIGAAPYERTETRTTERNGAGPRTLSTKAGDIDLRIPKLRKGSFFPLILEPRRRIDQALCAGEGGLRRRGVDPRHTCNINPSSAPTSSRSASPYTINMTTLDSSWSPQSSATDTQRDAGDPHTYPRRTLPRPRSRTPRPRRPPHACHHQPGHE